MDVGMGGIPLMFKLDQAPRDLYASYFQNGALEYKVIMIGM